MEVFDPKEMRKKKREEKFDAALDKFKAWFERNREIIYMATPLIITGLTTTVKVTGKAINVRKERNLKELYVYDRTIGQYAKTKRPLRAKEKLELARRHEKGENITEVLNDMRLLK